ncbi:MAG TPA: hypothetical protein VJK02_19280 [Anaerolineales bacterium]|nr:hypothetical protein [Anaerolineales bacterium]
MDQQRNSQPDLGDELRNLGANLKQVLEEAWHSEERERLQQEIESGLQDVAETLRGAAADFERSPAGRRLKSEMQDIGEKMRSGALQGEVRLELVDILRKLNDELQAAASRLSDRRSSGDKEERT